MRGFVGLPYKKIDVDTQVTTTEVLESTYRPETFTEIKPDGGREETIYWFPDKMLDKESQIVWLGLQKKAEEKSRNEINKLKLQQEGNENQIKALIKRGNKFEKDYLDKFYELENIQKKWWYKFFNWCGLRT
jgi:hypothetical protein